MKTLNIFYKSIVFLVVGLLVFYFVMILKTKKVLNHSFAIVSGNSMYPALKDGDFLIVKQTHNCEIGEIICFYDVENKKVVHRVLEISDYKITTKGDFNKVCDVPISSQNVIGVVVFKSGIIGYVIKNLHIVLICLCVYVFFNLKNLDKCDIIYLWMK